MKRSVNLFLLCVWVVLSMIGSVHGQMTGSLPIEPEMYFSYPEWKAPDLPELKKERFFISQLFPAAGNQGAQGSCTAWALAYAGMSYLEGVRRGKTPDTNSRIYSPAYMYNQIAFVVDGKEKGSLIVDGLHLLKEQGVPTLEEFPYTDRDFKRMPSPEVRQAAKDHTIKQFGRLTNTKGIKAALRMGYPVVIAMQTSPQFQNRSQTFEVYDTRHFERGQVEWKEKAKAKGIRPEDFQHHLHAMTIMGFDDTKNAFLVINSWG